MTENMAYYTERLQCSNEEKDACLETVAKLYRLRLHAYRAGILVAETLAEEEPDPFFRVCLQEFAELSWDPDGLEQLLSHYLMAGDYRGGAFLNAVLICRAIVLLARRYKNAEHATEDYSLIKDWDEALGEALRGYFGAEYREKVMAVIQRELKNSQSTRETFSLNSDFDKLVELSPQQRDWLVRQVPNRTLRYALKIGGSAVSEFLMEGMENRAEFERELEITCNVRAVDVGIAQKEMIDKAKEAPACM